MPTHETHETCGGRIDAIRSATDEVLGWHCSLCFMVFAARVCVVCQTPYRATTSSETCSFGCNKRAAHLRKRNTSRTDDEETKP
jgi:hypothetical protein